MNRAVATRKFYAFEQNDLPPGKELPIARLRAMGERIWRDNTGRRDRCPVIVAGRGMRHCDGRLVSYCEGRSRIVLARNQRDTKILIHEMTHALGPETHGPRFQARYLSLWLRYGA